MNITEVAKRAKVSTATVSRVLNNASVVKSSTRARVMKAVNELKYYPNLHARSLAGGKSRTFGVIASNMENPFFFDIYKTVEADAHARGHEVVVANTDYRPEQLVASIRLMIGRRVAGLAVVVSEMDPALIKELAESRIPVVFYDVGAPRLNGQIWLYGSSKAAIVAQVTHPRQGVMPVWDGRLSNVAIKMAATYVHSLGGGQ